MTTAIYILSWVGAIICMAVGFLLAVPVCIALCVAALYYSTRGHRLGVRRNPRIPFEP